MMVARVRVIVISLVFEIEQQSNPGLCREP
jgi:hypothetical protein